MSSVITSGRIRLQPLAASRHRRALPVVIDLSRDDGQPTMGDLRLAATKLEGMGRFESAHRLWTAFGQAAASIDDLELQNWAEQRAADAIEIASELYAEQHRRSGVRYDYDAIAAERRAGRSVAAVASDHGCSTSTVRRAVEQVGRRDEVLAANPDLEIALTEGADPELLASHYGIDASLVRWMLALQFDRRD